MDQSEAGELLGKTPKKQRCERLCRVCGKTFTTTARGVFCSPLCRWRSAYERRRRQVEESA